MFTGKERDSESGLDYFGARYYGSALGRWTSPDWSETPQAVPYALISNPQTLNLYSYVRNNPLVWIDPDGHSGDDGCTWDPKTNTLKCKPAAISNFPFLNNRMLPGVIYGNPKGPKGNLVGGCPLSTCHTYDGLFPPLRMSHFPDLEFIIAMGFGTVPPLSNLTDLLSVEDVIANPALLDGLTPEEVQEFVARNPEWHAESRAKGSQEGKGLILGGHHGPTPYWKVSSPETDTVRIGPQFKK
jgi:RHS repeat-associated protein